MYFEGDHKSIFKYFDDNYYERGPLKRNIRGKQIRAPPLFSIQEWSVFNRVDEELDRTSNAAEGHHNRLRILSNGSHINLWHLISLLMMDENQKDTKCNM